MVAKSPAAAADPMALQVAVLASEVLAAPAVLAALAVLEAPEAPEALVVGKRDVST